MGILTLTADCPVPMQLRSFLRGKAGVSARTITRLKAVPDGITCNGRPIRTVDTVCAGDVICLHLPETCDLTPNPALNVPAVYETAQVIAVNKPAEMPSHPSMLHRDDTLGNWFAAHYPDCGFHLLNRLDRNTSGLCLIAKTAYAAHALRGSVRKTYFALVPNGLTQAGTVDAPIAREQESVITRCVRADGRRAVTHYAPVQITPRGTLLRITLETGRTHQIRVHLAHIGYPLLGDALYGGDCTILHTHALHCGELCFPDPETGAEIALTAPLRPDMQAILEEST